MVTMNSLFQMLVVLNGIKLQKRTIHLLNGISYHLISHVYRLKSFEYIRNRSSKWLWTLVDHIKSSQLHSSFYSTHQHINKFIHTHVRYWFCRLDSIRRQMMVCPSSDCLVKIHIKGPQCLHLGQRRLLWLERKDTKNCTQLDSDVILSKSSTYGDSPLTAFYFPNFHSHM